MAYDPSDFLSDDTIDRDPLISKWRGQAIVAMDNGVDPLKVNKLLRQKMEDRGYDVSRVTMPLVPTKDGESGEETDVAKAVKDLWAKPNKETKSDYGAAVVPQVVKDINSVQSSPEPFGRGIGDVQAGSATTAPVTAWDNLKKNVSDDVGTFTSGVKGLLSGNPYDVAPDDTRKVIGTGEGFARRTVETVSDLPAVAASVPGAALAMQAYDWFKGGPTTPEKYEQAVKDTVGIDETKMRFESPRSEFAALAGSDILTSLAPGLKGAHDLGAAARAGKAAKELDETLSNLPKTGDSHFDAGASAYKDIAAANEDLDKPLPQYGEKGQTELNLPPQAEPTAAIDDLFSGKTKDAADVEAAREAAGRATALPEANRLAQQGLLPGVEPAPVGELPSQRSPLEQNMLENTAERQGQLPDANAAPSAPEGPAQGSLLPEESPEQLGLGSLPQGPERPVAPPSPDVVAPAQPPLGRVEAAIQAKRASDDVRLAEPTSPDMGGGVFARNANVPGDVRTRLENGNLVGQHVLDHLIDDPDKMYQHAPEAREAAADLQRAGDKLGGLDTQIVQFDKNDPVHQDVKARTKNWDNSAAVYDPHTNRIYVNRDANMSTLVHEIGHAVRHKALSLGEARQLEPAAQSAYDTLNHVFQTLKPQLQDAAEASASRLNAAGAKQMPIEADWRQRTYGLTDIHELMSEMDANQHFRNSLRNLKITEPDQIKLGMSPTAWGRVRNAFDVVKKLVGKAMGLSDKTPSNALDALFAAKDDFFGKIDERTARNIKAQNARNTIPDTSFLGEQVPFRAEAGGAESDNLRAPRGKFNVGARELLTERGNVPAATDARRAMQGEVNAARAVSTSFKNLAESQRDAINLDHVNDILTNTPNAKNAMAAMRQASPKLAEALNDMRQRKYNMGLKIADEADRNPNSTPEQLAVAKKIREHSLEWLPRIYARDKIKGWTEKFMEGVDKGQPKEVATYNAAKQYLAGQLFPGADRLATMKADELADLYRAHTGLDPDAQYKGFDPKVKQEAMRAQIASKINDYGNVDAFLDNAVRKVAKLDPDDISAITTYFKSVKLGSNVLAARTHAPEALRNLWGEVHDPLAKMYYGIEEQASQHAQLKAQNDLRDTGLKTGLFAQRPTSGGDVQLTGASFGPLQGLYTTKDIAHTLQSQRALSSSLGDLMQMSIGDMGGRVLLPKMIEYLITRPITYAARGAKLANIIGNLGNDPNNFVGSFLQLASNGNVNPITWAKGAKTMIEAIGSGMKRSMSPELERAFRLNLLEFSQTEEMRNNPHSAALARILDDISGKPNPIQALAKAGKESWALFHEVYGAMDLWSKLANFENEYALQKRWNPNMPEAQLEKMVADRINNTNITPSHTPRILKLTESVGATQYEPYYYQVAKTTVTNSIEGGKDVINGIRSGNYEMAAHGAARMAGTALYLTKANAMYAGMIAGALGLKGLVTQRLDDSDPRKKLLDKDDYTSSIDPMIVKDPNNKEAGEYVMDVSRPNPFAPISAPINRLYQAAMLARTDPKAAEEQAKIAIENLNSITWKNPNSLWSQLIKVAKGSQPSTAATAPTTYNQIASYLTQHTGMSPENADRLITGLGIYTPKTLKNIAAAKEIPGETPLKGLVTAGVGAQKFNAAEEMQKFIGPQLRAAVTTARKPYVDLLRANYDISPESLDDQFKSHLKDLVDPYEKMKAAVDAAKAQGTGDHEIMIRLVNSGVGPEAAGMLLKNQPMPAMLMLGDPSSALVSEIKRETDPVKQKEMIKRAEDKAKMFVGLFKKYKDVTMDQLEAE